MLSSLCDLFATMNVAVLYLFEIRLKLKVESIGICRKEFHFGYALRNLLHLASRNSVVKRVARFLNFLVEVTKR